MTRMNGKALLSSAIALVLGTASGILDGEAAAAAPAQPATLGEVSSFSNPRVPDFDLRQRADQDMSAVQTAEQREALAAFLDAHPNAVARRHEASGSIDVIYGFADSASGGSPESMAQNFIADHSGMLGVADPASLVLDAFASREALGGHLLRFDQTFDGAPVVGAGVGVVLDGAGNVRAVSGPFYSSLSVDTSPGRSADQALAAAADDLAPYALDLPQAALEVLNPAYDLIEQQLGVLATPHPELVVLPTAGGGRLAWRFFKFSRNPFGMFQYTVDAHTGEILVRENFVRTQEDPLPFTADVFPSSPPITDALKERGALLDADGGEVERPLGQVRVELRKFDESNVTTGIDGVLTGDHALITNALASKLPFAQAAAGTWHFDRDELPLKGRTDEVDRKSVV